MLSEKILRKLIPYRIGHQVGLVFGLLLTGALGFLGFSLINTSRQAVIDSVLRDYDTIVKGASRELATHVTQPQELLVNTAALLANLPQHKPETFKAVIYQTLINQANRFERITLINAAGQEIIASDWQNPLKDRSVEIIFQQVKTNPQPTISRVYFSPEHFPFISIAVPVRRLNEVTGFLLAEVKLSGLWDVVNRIKLPDGESFLVDEEGYMLVHNEERRVYRAEDLSGLAVVQAALQGQSGSKEQTAGSENESTNSAGPKTDWLYAYAPVQPFGWGLIIRQPARAAYAFSDRMQKTALITIALAILSAGGLSWLLARRIVKPINKIVTASEQVALGNLEQEITSKRQDEMGGLLSSFNEMIKKLRQVRRLEKLSTIGLATSKIGHEIRNPLVAMKTFIQLLGRKHEDKEFIHNFNNIVPSEMARLEKMVNELTEFSKAPQLRLADCEPDRIIRNSLDLFREEFQEKKITVLTNLETNHRCPDMHRDFTSLRLRADNDRLKQVLINLIRNALEAMPEGGQLEVNAQMSNGRTSLSPADSSRNDSCPDIIGTCVIEIKDTGCGIPSEAQTNLFEPFQTFNKKGGLGLGLTICKEIITQHRGTIEVDSRLNQGTTFKITLPIE
ncbi:MAG: ATP-binding protein [Planctomycetota bacterium]